MGSEMCIRDRVITENGQTTEVLANTSTYNKRDEVVYVGTAQAASDEAESTSDTAS